MNLESGVSCKSLPLCKGMQRRDAATPHQATRGWRRAVLREPVPNWDLNLKGFQGRNKSLGKQVRQEHTPSDRPGQSGSMWGCPRHSDRGFLLSAWLKPALGGCSVLLSEASGKTDMQAGLGKHVYQREGWESTDRSNENRNTLGGFFMQVRTSPKQHMLTSVRLFPFFCLMASFNFSSKKVKHSAKYVYSF